MGELTPLTSGSWPPTLADVKAYLMGAASYTGNDTLIESVRSRAQARVETYLGRRVLSASRTYYLDGPGGVMLYLPDWPITAITSIAYSADYPRDWTADVRDADEYMISTDGTDSETAQGILRIDGMTWGRGAKVWRVIATTGYASGSVPADLYHATVQTAVWMYQTAEGQRLGLSSKSTDGGSLAYEAEGKLPLEIRDALARYRRVGV